MTSDPESGTYPCLTCAFWQPRDRERDHRAPCALGYGNPAFNDTCAHHSARELVPARSEVDMQSQARGPMTYQGWARKIQGKP